MDDTILIISCDGSDDRSSYFRTQEEPEETNQSTVPVTDDRTQLGLYSDELRVLRWMLRFLSLWCPASARWVERCAYPLLVNLLLLQVIISDFYVLATQNWKSLEVCVLLAIDLGMYFSHLFGVVYFRSRDLEDNILHFNLNLRFKDALGKKLKRLKIGIILSYLMLAVVVLLFFNTEAWLNGPFQCKSSFKFLHGILNRIFCLLNYPTNIYGVGNSLAISWTMCLFQQICCVRLQQLSAIYWQWTGETEEAIYNHLENYSRKVSLSCSHLTKWFVTHNIILIIATPFLFADIFKGFKELRPNNAVHTGLFVGFLIYTVVIWVVPLYFAELLQIHDEDFCTTVNEFCPGSFREHLGRESPNQHLVLQNDDYHGQERRFTFASRTEVNKFLSYLKNRKSGFLMESYSFQLKLSMFSVFLAVLSFANRLVT